MTLNGYDVDKVAHEVDGGCEAKYDLPGSKGHVFGGYVANQQGYNRTDNTWKWLNNLFYNKQSKIIERKNYFLQQ